jgi:hypothetical protein
MRQMEPGSGNHCCKENLMKAGKIVLWTFAALLLTGVLYAFSMAGGTGIGKLTFPFGGIQRFGLGQSVAVDQTETIRPDAFKRIEILTDSPDLAVRVVSGGDAAVHLGGTVRTTSPKSLPMLVMEEKGDTLVFRLVREQQGIFGIYSGNLVLTADLPEGWQGNLVLRSASADIKLDGGEYASLEIGSASGDFSLGALKTTGNLSLETTSGEINLKEAVAGTIRIASQSGDIQAGVLKADSIALRGASSEIEASDLSGRVEATTASGDVSLTVVNPKDAISVGTASGRVKIKVPAGTGLDVDAGSTSGSVGGSLSLDGGRKAEHAWTGTTGDKAVRIRVNTVSGDISLD